MTTTKEPIENLNLDSNESFFFEFQIFENEDFYASTNDFTEAVKYYLEILHDTPEANLTFQRRKVTPWETMTKESINLLNTISKK